MKKFLLFAAAAAVMMCANAQPTVEQLWKVDGMANIAPTNDCRQGVGMNGKIYINNKADLKVMVIGEGGLADEEYPGGANCGIGRDEAGNLVISNGAFPAEWACDGETPVIKVVDVNNPENVKEYALPEEVAGFGRSDLLGFAKGNLLENGVLYFCGAASDQTLVIVTITDGEVNLDETYVADIEGGVTPSSNPIYFYKNKDGEDRLLYVNRTQVNGGGNIGIKVLAAEGDGFVVESTPVMPGKSASNGGMIFVWNGEEYAVYPYGGNYLDGFAIVKIGEEEALYVKEPELAANPNTFQANWVNAEVVEDGVMIYHYVPGAYAEAFKMTDGSAPIEDAKYYVVGGFNAWDTNAGEEITEEGATINVQEQNLEDSEDTNQEFKIITFNADGGITWIGGEDENPNDNIPMLLTDELISNGIEITLVTPGANFRLPAAGSYTIKLVESGEAKAGFESLKMVVIKNDAPSAVNDINSKTVANVKYVNLAGIESNKPFDGVNIAVTTYTDGTKSAAKVIK